ncbi:bifunctional [glutamine synthetase] adenylyltransferase/[glutamine synthetase]-adenylyl-L-tyrosine phosphorylase [Microbacterium rhizomatis]|uniref:Bifunctional [glutamine synthetase] adenylyltransferase/[glutamine synthetase]-adenylyl-L-tyrosine phosphorylase n=1 Tax=Microbacterium rhizomatis TaxID=1631477 RepID=A0A5J5J332_9MICO|nr:bifunctional [glutamine synthetase] adenylyltransferase/[glutamine synthetase]-adenylyl-L-tyrosine phosphorylase [Microbacterium rhizomatis]KAA9110501.1 bifunctional [glutamine synthetase] adenylyltransferase/[glutamine synthetase]-adenylyl-L-tyrosine phosphorylase [Microbacterium rhizomatis]
MSSGDRSSALTELARLGFSDLGTVDALLDELEAAIDVPRHDLIAAAGGAADPDAALAGMVRVARRSAAPVRDVLGTERGSRVVWALLGASDGFADFYLRHPDELLHLRDAGERLPTPEELTSELLGAVGAVEGFASGGTEAEWVALRVRYRRLLAAIAGYDLLHADPVGAVKDVAARLADAAGAALEASLAVARTRISTGGAVGGLFPREQVAATRLAIIGMGKSGARELNYVSDVDVIFVGGADEDTIDDSRAIDIATRLAVQTMRGISSVEIEPPLWEVDANLRPEGKQGALVRTLDSHLSYYDRWAKSWEFQALLKARPLAGDPELGEQYVSAVQPKIWTSAARENFVDSVQRMRERVTEHIPPDEVAYQLKLGPGGIRDIEFTVQLLQLVHGLTDDRIRQRGTLDAIEVLVAGGYIGRPEAGVFAHDYRALRVLEHRMQLRALRRTHLMPATPEGLRILARASGLADGGQKLWELWEAIKREVRDIHVRLFYRPLLSAVASLPEEGRSLSTEQAHDRLAAIGFRNPAGALRHIGALTSGLSRKATIQRHLMPVMIQWFAEGADPDYGLLAFRRISERLGDSPWFLRMLRDSSAAAQSLTRVLAGSRFIGELMEWIPEASAWLDDEEQLHPRRGVLLQDEARAIQQRHSGVEDAVRAVRSIRRREILRTAMGGLLDVQSIEEVAGSLTTITEVSIQATLRAVRRELVPPDAGDFDFAIIAMGRFGGRELGFGSDADILYVYRAPDMDPDRGQRLALDIVAELRRRSEDFRLPLDLDADLRPEGRNGPLARSLEAYAEYYRRWSMSWEAQALLRARGFAGSVNLIRDFTALADAVRYPATVDPHGIREIKRIKARVENERLPQGIDRARHLKLGPGTLSDVEWLVQLLQLEHGARIPGLRTTSTMGALHAAEAAGLLSPVAAERLGEAWRLASRLRSANTLWSGQTSDVLPTDRQQLDGIARILGYPPRSASEIEERYFATTRRARRIFEKLFYG